MVAGTTTTALVFGIGAFAICVLPWFYSQSSDEEEETMGIDRSIDHRSPIEENSSSNSGFRAIFLRASDWVKGVIPKTGLTVCRGSGNRDSATTEPTVREFCQEHSIIDGPDQMAQRLHDFQSEYYSKQSRKSHFPETHELMEVDSETRTRQICCYVDEASKKCSRNFLTMPGEPVAHSTWKSDNLVGSSIYRQHCKRRYNDPRMKKELLLNLEEEEESRIEEMPLDLSIPGESCRIKNSPDVHDENTISSIFHEKHKPESKKNNCTFNITEKKSVSQINIEKSILMDENVKGDGSGMRKKVFRDVLDFLRVKKASGKSNKASTRSDSIKFYRVISSSFPRDENKNNVSNSAKILLENKKSDTFVIDRNDKKVDLKNSQISCDQGFSRKFKKIFNFRNHFVDKAPGLDKSDEKMKIPSDAIERAPWRNISSLKSQDDSTKPKTTEFQNISPYLKMGSITYVNDDYIEPCTEL